MNDIVVALKAVKKRNPDAWKLIGAISGFGESVIKDIATEKREATTSERMLLEVYKDFV